jgi:protease I
LVLFLQKKNCLNLHRLQAHEDMSTKVAAVACKNNVWCGWRHSPFVRSIQMANMKSQKIAVLATDGFEQAELVEPVAALRAAGATVHVISPKGGEIQGMKQDQKGDKTKVDLELSHAKAADYDGLVLPGGVANPDTLRINEKAIAFIREFVQAGKPIAAVCHGPWTLIEAQAVKGKKITSWPSLKTDLTNAGATWVDQEVVVDGNLVTSRKPDDLPAFNRAFIEVLSKDGGEMRKAS